MFGECMLELSSSSASQFQQSYAGDVYSVATYLSRLASKLTINMYTAVGRDPFSTQLTKALHNENVNTQLIARHPDKMLGLYVIRNDESGEREFLYWRDDSAAKHCLKLSPPKQLPRPDVFYLSGISLAILDETDRELLITQISTWKQYGTVVVFDPNHRPKLWNCPEVAKKCYRKIFALSDIALPGMDDLHTLYGYSQPEQAITWLKGLGCTDIVVKDGSRNIHYASKEGQGQFKVVPVKQVIDATAAGDSFAAGFLARRLQGDSAEQAIAYACEVSSQVLLHQGAIIPKNKFRIPKAIYG